MLFSNLLEYIHNAPLGPHSGCCKTLRIHNDWLKHAYRYLHFKIILVQLDSNVCDCFLNEPGRPQYQDELQVPWKCPLNTSSGSSKHTHILEYFIFVEGCKMKCLDVHSGTQTKAADHIHSLELTAILDREAFTELHLSFRRSMMMMKPMLAASRLQRPDIHIN